MKKPRGAMTLEDIVITDALNQRAGRTPDHEAENTALLRLGEQLTESRAKLFQCLVVVARRLCGAGTAGLSIIGTNAEGENVFKWEALAGAYRNFVGGTSPIDFSPCGICLQRGTPQLYDRPGRYFKYLAKVQPPILEGLVVPIYVQRKPVGTIWIVSHDANTHFDFEHVRVLKNIAGFVGAAMHRFESENQFQRSEIFNRSLVDNSPDCIKVLDAEGRLIFLNEPGRKTLGIPSVNDVLNKDWVSFWEGEDREKAQRAMVQAIEGKTANFRGYRPTFTGEPKWWDVRVCPLPQSDGRTLVISRDVTAHKKFEELISESQTQLWQYALGLEDRVNERTRELRAANDELRLMSRRLVKSQDDERRRLAKELHDEMGQQLTALKLMLERCATSTPSPDLGRAREVLSGLTRQMSDLSFDLTESLPDHLSLTAALKWHVRKVSNDSKLKVSLKCDGQRALSTIPSEIKRTCFRVVQEALTNVAKHAKSAEANVALGFRKSNLCVRVEDFGCGFKANDGRGCGLKGMEERVLLLGGTFNIRSQPARGTVVEASIPVTPS